MSPQWSKFLEQIGAPMRTAPRLTNVFAAGVIREGLWHEFRAYDRLFRLFGPSRRSPWFPFHCPTLFAAIDRLNLSPQLIELAPEVLAERPPEAWSWLTPGTLTIVELDGGLAAQIGGKLVAESPSGAQLVSTFDHWPRANPQRASRISGVQNLPALPWPPQNVFTGVAIDSMDVIHSMVSLAPEIYRRLSNGIDPDAPPIWLCDRRRVRTVKPGPGDYDNRYFIDDSLLPTPLVLRQHGIAGLVYFGPDADAVPSDDLTVWLNQCQRAGMALRRVALDDVRTWVTPLPMAAPAERRLAGRKFPKSQIGGFGRKIPEPQEGSGGSFSGGGG